MKIDRAYTVHSCVAVPVTAKATINGVVRDVTVDGVALELVSEDGAGHSFSLIPDDPGPVLAAFKVGAAVTLSLEAPDPVETEQPTEPETAVDPAAVGVAAAEAP